MNQTTQREGRLPTMAELKPILAPYQKADLRHSLWQLANTLIPYAVLWFLMVRALQVSIWLMLPLAVLAGGFLMRVFIFFHDCGHNSFFPTTQANRRIGSLLGVLVFTPGGQWWHSHALHHATSGNLDKRGDGDVTMLTLEEFYDSALLQRLGYKFFRNPLIMFGLGPIFMFFLMHRLPLPHYGKKQTLSVVWTNLGILALATAISLVIGLKAYLIIQFTVMWLAGMAGIFMFYLQHQFEESYWERNRNWNYVASALLGASYFHLPRLLQWFTGNIGFHHIHHLSPRIPNYNLEKVHTGSPLIQKWTHEISLSEGFETVKYKVWHELGKKMVTWPGAEKVLQAETQQEIAAVQSEISSPPEIDPSQPAGRERQMRL